MAPERIRLILGETGSGDLAAPTDIYSIGVVLFEALTGGVPFEPAGLADVNQVARDLLRRRSIAGPHIATSNSEVPRSLARLLDRCLVDNPGERPSAESLEYELDRHLRRRVRRNRVFLGCVGFVGTGVIAWQLSAGTQPVPDMRPQPDSVAAPRPSTPDEFFNRGLEHLRSDDLEAATKDFGNARRINPDGRSTAFLAYCQSRSGTHDAAAILYLKAIKDYGYGAAWVHCNRAYSLIRSGSPQDVRLSIDESNAALALEPELRAARLNRAYARFLVNFDAKTQTLANPEDCLSDLEAVMSVGPYTADLYYKAALILTAAAAGREDRYARAVTYLREAVRRGRNPKLLAQEPVFQVHLVARKDFEQAANLPPAEQPESVINLHVVDPLGR